MVFGNSRIICAIFLAISISGCEQISELTQPSAKDVLNSYLDATIGGRPEEAYDRISTEDKAVKSLAEYKTESNKKNSAIATALAGTVTYEVVNIVEAGKIADANVEMILPDIRVIFKDIMGAAFSSAFGGKDQDEIKKALADKYQTEEIPTVTKVKEFHLVKENDGWKVFLDWKAMKAAKEEKEKTASLFSEAKKLEKSKKFFQAIKKYEEILAIDNKSVEAKKGLKDAKKEFLNAKLKQKYLKNVVLYDLKAKYYDTYIEKNIPGVEFKIKNKGDQTLKKVEVTVYFKDSKGTVIAEEDYHPVLVSKYSFGGDNKPLKPSYIWQMEKGKFYTAKNVPSEWKEGVVTAKITDIEFSE